MPYQLLLRTLLLPLLLLLAVSIPAQNTPDLTAPWSLKQCIDYALQHNLTIKQSELNLKVADINYLQSKMNVLPTLNGNISHINNYGRTIDPFTNQFATDAVLSQNFSLSSSLLLFNGLQNYNTIGEQKYNLLASKEDHRKMLNDISLSIATAYLQILLAEELLSIADAQAGITKLQVDRTKKLVEAGSLAKSFLFEIEAQYATEELNRVNMENQLTMAYLNLVQMLDLQDAKNFKIVRPNLEIPNFSVLSMPPEQIFQMALSGMPEIRSSEYKVKSSEKALRVARGGMSPRLVLSGSYGTGYSGASKDMSITPTGSWDTTFYFTSGGDFVLTPEYNTTYTTTPFGDQIDQNLNRSVGLHLSLPLFNGYSVRSNIQRSRINYLHSQLQLDLTKNALRKNIQQAYADALAALKKYQATEQSVKALEESFRFTEEKFNVNMVNAFDYADAKNRLARVRSELSQAKFDFFFKIKVLEYYQGKPLQFE
ncbi:MAG: TolC family protein [Bacteroidia bacterium]|nr:TolC family protein [Bacteroidia bacterium]